MLSVRFCVLTIDQGRKSLGADGEHLEEKANEVISDTEEYLNCTSVFAAALDDLEHIIRSLQEEQQPDASVGKTTLGLAQALAYFKNLLSSLLLLRSQTKRLFKRMEQIQPAVLMTDPILHDMGTDSLFNRSYP